MQIHVLLCTLGFTSQDIYFYLLKIFRLKNVAMKVRTSAVTKAKFPAFKTSGYESRF